MRSLRILAVLAIVGGLLAASALTVTAAGGRPFSTALSGAEEVPGPGDPDGAGWASITVNPGLGQVCYSLEVSGIAPAAAAHIHSAPAGVAGPIVVHFAAPSTGSSSGCADVTRELAMSIIRNPTAYYVNVHNSEHPAGAVRGQLGD
jgi:hypothetical protein